MLFAKALLVGASALISAVAAQSDLAFTSTFTSVTAGKPVSVTYSGGDKTAPVTISLREGPSNNLGAPTVLTSSSTGGSYTWTPSTSLPSGSDYALQITQGSAFNYWGPFSITGGAPSGASISASASSSASSSLPTTGLNGTLANATTTFLGTAASAGTGTPLPANTTFSSATLSAAPTLTTTPSSSSSPSATSSTVAPTKTAGASRAMSSPMALVLMGVVAMICFS
ncbi:MAG: hypothetical protein M1838_004789 [Thelocarpon superellum]|nr:MAG: hypothetical protein M1838_004789 [Thelocarpon superellum]